MNTTQTFYNKMQFSLVNMPQYIGHFWAHCTKARQETGSKQEDNGIVRELKYQRFSALNVD